METRGWKLLMLIPRLLLTRPPRGGLVPQERLKERVARFNAGEWVPLLESSLECSMQGSVARSRRRRRATDEPQSRTGRALELARMGELSHARVDLLLKNLRTSRRGAAAGPSGTTTEHLKILLDEVAILFVRGQIPPEILEGVRVGRMTALQKPDGGVRGIVVGDVMRRLVARTLAQQFGPQAEGATHPFQYALSTRAGTECVAHVVQALTSLDKGATILSIDGVGAYDTISRKALLRGVADMVDGDKLIPFVRQFYSSPSTYLWEDEVGETRRIQQGEGGEQGDPLMPLLFSVGQHRALVEVQASLRAGERLFAFLDDIHVVCSPERVGDVYKLVEHALRTKTGISIHLGKTKLWNAEGRKPGVADALTRAAQKEKPEAVVWRGDQSLPTVK